MIAEIQYSRVPLAIAAGAVFTLIGIAYRLGQSRGVSAIQVLGGLCIVGSVAFGAKALWLDEPNVPACVWLWGAAGGLTQYVMVKFVAAALRRGPLSPLWCAISLSFIGPVIYGRVMLGEMLSLWQYAGFACGVGCVVAGSWQGGAPGKTHKGPPTQHAIYGLLLLMIMVLNAVLMIGMKDLAAHVHPNGSTYAEAFPGAFSLAVDVVLGGLILIDQFATGAWRSIRRPLIWLGLMAGGGSIGGMLLMMPAASLPAAVFFTLSSVSGICTVAVVSVLALGERVNVPWLVTIVLGVLTAVLLNLRF